MRKLSQIVLMVLLVSLFISFGTAKVTAFTAESIFDEIAESDFYANLKKSSELFDMALAAYTYRSLLCEQYFYTDEYAGSFIDKFGILNVGVVGLPQAKSEYFGQVNYLPKQFSYNFLKDLKAELSDTMDDLGIFTVGIDEERNQVFVNLTDEKNVDKTVAFLAEKDIYRENSIRFLVEPNGCNKEDSTAPYGGECISGAVLVGRWLLL